MLTDLKALKPGIDVSGDQDDDLLTSMIGQVSSMILSYLSRPYLFKRQYTDTFQGSGMPSRMLRNYPVIDIASVSSGYLNIPAGDGLGPGYWLEPDEGIPPGRLQLVHLNDFCFERGMCKIIYEAGYFISEEPQVAATSVTVAAPWGAWAMDGGVSYATGAPLTLVASAPQVGQYALGKLRGQYQFSAADAGIAMLISYSYVPAIVEQCCIKIIAEQYEYMDRIGQKSVNTQGEVVSFDLSDMPQYVKTALQPYRRLVPV